MLKHNKYNDIGIKLKLLTYIVSHNIKFKFNRESVSNKIVNNYVKLGRYDKAINYFEELLIKKKKEEYYFFLLNLYIMSNENEKRELLVANYKKTISCRSDFMSMMKKFNNSINDVDKFEYIKNYIKSKGATPVFILTENRGAGLKNKSAEERHLLSNPDLYLCTRPEWSKENNPPSYIKGLYSVEHKDKIKELYGYTAPIIKATKILHPNFNNGIVSVLNGLRTTKYQPKEPKKRVIFCGASTTFSTGVSDEDTLVSQIQKEVSLYHDDVKLENHGVIGMNLLLAINHLTQININKNDVVVLFDFDEFGTFKDESIKKIDLNDIERGKDFFTDLTKRSCHFSPKGNKKLAKIITNELILPSVIEKEVEQDSNLILCLKISKVLDNFKYYLYKQTAQLCESGEMKEYLDMLGNHTVSNELKVGSVAVNCNPITNGHMHLLKYASEQVDKLFIFVIEEDQSFFKFKDRLHLVTESTKHLNNVTVLPGGKFICTELTYPDYFDKDEQREVIADASMEAWFFCEYIAKKLNIKTIFLGNEPTCKVTRQYNQKMQELLPDYNIDVDIIERISAGKQVISASKVRACLKERDFETIKKIVPAPTYDFLKNNY